MLRKYFFILFFLTEQLLEAAVGLLVPDGGADEDIWRRTPKDLGQQLHQTAHDVGVIHHICTRGR